jgi:hypothetical protein
LLSSAIVLSFSLPLALAFLMGALPVGGLAGVTNSLPLFAFVFSLFLPVSLLAMFGVFDTFPELFC